MTMIERACLYIRLSVLEGFTPQRLSRIILRTVKDSSIFAVPGEGIAQPFGKIDSRMVAENSFRPFDVGKGVTNVTGPRRLIFWLEVCARDLLYLRQELIECGPRT